MESLDGAKNSLLSDEDDSESLDIPEHMSGLSLFSAVWFGEGFC